MKFADRFIQYLSWLYPLPKSLLNQQDELILKKWAKGRKNLVEIGVFEGQSAINICSVLSDCATFHLIDPFVSDSMVSRFRARKWLAKIRVAWHSKNRIVWHEDFSFNVIKNWSKPIDFIFIDGDHHENACVQDWNQWSRYVEIKGIVLFHDARKGKSKNQKFSGWPGPTAVVDRLFRGNNPVEKNWRIVDEDGSIVVVERISS